MLDFRLAMVLVLAGTSACARPAPALDPKADAVISLTRETRSTFSLFTWNRITLDAATPREDWGAEFHRGYEHRVETSGARIIADCAAMTGVSLDLTSGKITRGESVAKAACGIQANSPIQSSEYLGRVDTKWGKAQRIRLTDPSNIRTYDVVENGALVAATIADLDGTMRVENVATELLGTVPDGDLFSEASLQSSAVADRYKALPASAN